MGNPARRLCRKGGRRRSRTEGWPSGKARGSQPQVGALTVASEPPRVGSIPTPSDEDRFHYVRPPPGFLVLSMHFLAAASRTERAQPALSSPSSRTASSMVASWAFVSGTRRW